MPCNFVFFRGLSSQGEFPMDRARPIYSFPMSPAGSLAQRWLKKVLRMEPLPELLDPATGQQPHHQPCCRRPPVTFSGAEAWPAVSPPGEWLSGHLWGGASACACPEPGLRWPPRVTPHLSGAPEPAGGGLLSILCDHGSPVFVSGPEVPPAGCWGTWPAWRL